MLPLRSCFGMVRGGLFRRFGICHNLTNKRITVQRFRVNYFATDDPPFFQILPNLFRVDVVERIFNAFLILFLRIGNHGVEIKICKIGIQFRKVFTAHLVDSFFVNLIHQPAFCQVCKNLNCMLTVRGRTISKINMGKIGIIRILLECFLEIKANQFLCSFQRRLFQGLLGRKGPQSVIPSENREFSFQVGRHSFQPTFSHCVKAIFWLGCFPHGQHHGFINGLDTLRVKKLTLNFFDIFPVVCLFTGSGITIRGIIKEICNEICQPIYFVVGHLFRITGI